MKAGLAAFAVAGLLLAGLPILLVQPDHGHAPPPAEHQLLNVGNVDSRYANAGYLQTIIELPSHGQRVSQMLRYYALLERQNRGVGQSFDPKLADVLAIEDPAERQAAFAKWDTGPKPTLFSP